MNQLEEITPIQIIELFDTTKAQRESFVNKLMGEIYAGTVDPLKVHLQLKCTEQILKSINDKPEYKEAVLDSANKYNLKSFQFQSAKVEIKEVGVKYDWSKCEDPRLIELMGQEQAIKEAIKLRQSFLQGAPEEGVLITDEETGETCKVYPPVKSSTTSVVVMLK